MQIHSNLPLCTRKYADFTHFFAVIFDFYQPDLSRFIFCYEIGNTALDVISFVIYTGIAQSNGSLKILIEIPAGMQEDLENTLNTLTKGEVALTVVSKK